VVQDTIGTSKIRKYNNNYRINQQQQQQVIRNAYYGKTKSLFRTVKDV